MYTVRIYLKYRRKRERERARKRERECVCVCVRERERERREKKRKEEKRAHKTQPNDQISLFISYPSPLSASGLMYNGVPTFENASGV